MNRFSLCLLALLLAGNAQAEQLQLVGKARLEVLFWSIYDSRLYTADGSYTDGQRPLRLELEYLRDIEAADLVEQTRNEWHQSLMLVPSRIVTFLALRVISPLAIGPMPDAPMLPKTAFIISSSVGAPGTAAVMPLAIR